MVRLIIYQRQTFINKSRLLAQNGGDSTQVVNKCSKSRIPVCRSPFQGMRALLVRHPTDRYPITLIIFVFYTAREYKFPRVNISFVISGHQNNNAEVKEGNLVDPKIFRSINQAKQVSSNQCEFCLTYSWLSYPNSSLFAHRPTF